MEPVTQMIAINAQTNMPNAVTTMGTDVFVAIHITKKAATAYLVCNKLPNVVAPNI